MDGGDASLLGYPLQVLLERFGFGIKSPNRGLRNEGGSVLVFVVGMLSILRWWCGDYRLDCAIICLDAGLGS